MAELTGGEGGETGGDDHGAPTSPATDHPEPTDSPTPLPSPTYPAAPDVTGLTFLEASRTLELADIPFEEVPTRDPSAEYGLVLDQSIAEGEPVTDVLELTVARRRPPVGAALESALVKDHERARIPEYISEDDQRNDLLVNMNPSGAYVCDNESPSSQEIADDTFRGWDAVLNGFQLASEVTSFTGDGAALFMRDVKRHARNCLGPGLRLVPQRKPAGTDGIIHLVYSGDGQEGLILYQGTPPTDWVLVRKDNVVVQVAIMVGYGSQSRDAVELAALGASRIR
ncbi:MAG: PASTA domain-containing protein [Actinomycetota bacterium]|nr:PASTA domain-containing protein [Actinomycetota bacterium]